MNAEPQSEAVTDDADWDDVLNVIELLIEDGYEVTNFEASTPNPEPEKAFLLEVERPTTERAPTDED